MDVVKNKPIIGIVSCSKSLAGYSIQSMNEYYLDSVSNFGAIPVIIPSVINGEDIKQIIDTLDGVLLPGSHSNVAPHYYGAEHHEPKLDERRDELALAIIRYTREANIPSLGICRGFQEMNVALGGSLFQHVLDHGFNDHREPESEDFNVKYVSAHPILIQGDGHFSQWTDGASEIQVNSLHNQGVARLANNLRIEAVASDGLVEAFSIENHPYFVGVQWHPEWKATKNTFSKLLFSNFIEAAKRYKTQRSHKLPT